MHAFAGPDMGWGDYNNTDCWDDMLDRDQPRVACDGVLNADAAAGDG